jgi:dolichol-phosphate mannosyltransferase
MALQFILFNLLRNVLGPTIANAIAIECAIINNFILNNIYTFNDRKLELSISWSLLTNLIKFNMYSMLSLIIQLIIVYVGTHLMKTNLLIENGLVFIGIMLGSIINYFIYSRLIWKQR